MERKYLGLLIALGLVALPLAGASISGCTTLPGGEQGLESLEAMSEAEFKRTMLWSSLGVKIAANRLIKEGVVSVDDLETAADLLDAVKTTPVVGGAELFVADLLDDSGLTSVEIEALVELVVFELDARGVFDNLSVLGTVELGERTEEFIDTLIGAVRDAAEVSQEELSEAQSVGITQ